MSCPSCGSEDIRVVETACMDTEWGIPNGEVLAFSVCASCDYGINEHTEGVCDCPKVPQWEFVVRKGHKLEPGDIIRMTGPGSYDVIRPSDHE